MSEEKPAWWPKNPYPEDIFPLDIVGLKEALPNERIRAAVAGYFGRIFWEIASKSILDAMIKAEAEFMEEATHDC